MSMPEPEVVSVDEKQRCPHCSDRTNVYRYTITFALTRVHTVCCKSCSQPFVVLERLGPGRGRSGFPAYQLGYDHYDPDKFGNLAAQGVLLWPRGDPQSERSRE